MANTKTRSEQGNSESQKSIQTKFLVLYLERKTIDILPSNIREDKNQSSIIISVDKKLHEEKGMGYNRRPLTHNYKIKHSP
jgi:hypothetical protein